MELFRINANWYVNKFLSALQLTNIIALCMPGVVNFQIADLDFFQGNTIFLGLGASGQPLSKPYGWLNSLVSIACFIFGAGIFALCSRKAGPLLRGTLATSFAVQMSCVIIAAALVEAKVVPITTPSQQATNRAQFHFIEILPLAFLAFQAGGQIVASRTLGLNEIPTTVLTSV